MFRPARIIRTFAPLVSLLLVCLFLAQPVVNAVHATPAFGVQKPTKDRPKKLPGGRDRHSLQRLKRLLQGNRRPHPEEVV